MKFLDVSNKELDALFVAQLDTLVSLFESHSFIELSRTTLVVHR